jgi:hypothetical protein
MEIYGCNEKGAITAVGFRRNLALGKMARAYG